VVIYLDWGDSSENRPRKVTDFQLRLSSADGTAASRNAPCSPSLLKFTVEFPPEENPGLHILKFAHTQYNVNHDNDVELKFRFYANPEAKQSNQVIVVKHFWIKNLELNYVEKTDMYPIELDMVAGDIEFSEGIKFAHLKHRWLAHGEKL